MNFFINMLIVARELINQIILIILNSFLVIFA
jgi:hypothetical protein